MSEADLDKESDRISKSAGLLAAAAVLILAIAFQAPFNIADKKSQTANNVSREAELLTTIAQMDALSLAASGVAIILCTFAGLPTSWLRARFQALILAGIVLFVASVAIVLVFATGLSLVYPGNWTISFIYYLFFILADILGLAAGMSWGLVIIVHAHTRCARLGFGAWCCSLFRRRPGASWIPLMSVVLPLLPVVFLAASAVETPAIFRRLR